MYEGKNLTYSYENMIHALTTNVFRMCIKFQCHCILLEYIQEKKRYIKSALSSICMFTEILDSEINPLIRYIMNNLVTLDLKLFKVTYVSCLNDLKLSALYAVVLSVS